MDIKKIFNTLLRYPASLHSYAERIQQKIPEWNNRERAHPALFRYGLVVLLCIMVVVIKMTYASIFNTVPPFILFYTVILLSAWYGGMRPGILAVIISSGLAFYFYKLPVTSPLLNATIVFSVFILEGLLIVAVSNAMHKALHSYEEKKDYIQYYASIARNISDAVIATDMNGMIQSWNKGAEQQYGWDASEAEGLRISTVIPTIYGYLQKEEIEDSLHKKGFWKGEVVHKRKNGSRVHVLTSLSIIHDEHDKPLGIVSVHRDISDRKKLEQGKDDFIALASHELKTPLTSTKLYLDVLKQRFEKQHDATSLNYISKVQEQVNKLQELVNYLLDVSKAQSGKLLFSKEQLRIDTFVKDVVQDIQQINPQRLISLDIKTDKKVYIDKDRTRQVLVNLLNNALKYSGQESKIIISVMKSGNTISVKVQDFGMGIPKEKQEKIFDRFYQVSDAKGYTYSGMGLGLYIAREIIEKHDGKLWVESIEGKGSTFIFTLPVSHT